MKQLIILLSLVLATTSCTKENKNYDSQNEADILKYIEAENLDAQKTPSGLYYVIDEQGDGIQPNSSSNVIVDYKGTYLNGKLFDESTEFGRPFNLQRVIRGFAEGIGLLNEGGKATLIIPSRLAYGNQDYNGVPAGSVLVFKIRLIATEEGIDKINDDQIVEYLKVNKISAQKSNSGLYYVIEEDGVGDKPTINSSVEVKYKGYYLNGEVFDDTKGDTATFEIQKIIPGFQEGLLLFNEGSKGKIFIPSSLGYGFGGRQGAIYGGAVIAFDIDLIKVIK